MNLGCLTGLALLENSAFRKFMISIEFGKYLMNTSVSITSTEQASCISTEESKVF